MEGSQEKAYSFLGSDTFPNIYDALVYERKFKRIFGGTNLMRARLLKSEPAIAKLIENKSDLSKLTLYHLKKRATSRSIRAREPSRIHYIYAIPCPTGPR